MKRKTIVSLLAVCALTLPGCSQNGGSTSSSSGQENTKAAESVTEKAETTTESAATEGSSESAETTQPEESSENGSNEDTKEQAKLFRGYLTPVTADGDYLLAEPDDNAGKTVDELTYGTFIEVYPCDKEGWYFGTVGIEYSGYIRKEKVKEWPHKLPFGDPFFGGYAAADDPLKLYREADVNAEVVTELEKGTQIDVYESDYDGWYMTVFENADDDIDYCFFKADLVEPVEPEDDSGDYDKYIKPFTGVWNKADQDETVKLTVVGTTYRLEIGEETNYGSISVVYDEYENGQKLPWISFCGNTGDVWEMFHPIEDGSPNDIYAGNSGDIHFVRGNIIYSDHPELESTAVHQMNTLTLLMGAMSGGGNIETDTACVLEGQPEGKQFVKVTDNRFPSPSSGLERWINNICTGSVREMLIKTSEEMFAVKDDEYYVDISSPHGFPYFLTQDGVDISDVTDTSFTATTRAFSEMDGYGRAYFVKDDYNWLITNYEFF